MFVYAQEEQVKQEDYYELSLEDLMNIPINSASKKDETLFDAPLSSYTITKSDIEKSGATSIMEALRLAPGVIVREQANGMYDIHIRGLENLTRTNGSFLKTNSYTLVMIDNRPVFNHGLGGTNWESLPIDLNDVERIEIVRGPSSPLFGPNAVTGVINIITKRLTDTSMLANVNVQAGTLGTTIANASVGKKFNDQLSLIVSGNFQDRDRVDEEYYNATTGTYVPLTTLFPDQTTRDERYPDPSRSLNKWGVNAFITYKASENISADLSVSHQQAEFQKIFVSNPLSDGKTDNTAFNLTLGIHDLKIRTSYLSGYALDLRTTVPRSENDYTVADVNAEYDIKLNDKYTLTPGLSYQTVTFDDRDYVNPGAGVIGLFNAENTINTLAGFLRSDLNFTDKLRVLAAIRIDKFSTPDEAYLAYELAATYDINEKNLIRAAITRSNSGSFMGYNYLDIAGAQVGDDNLDLITVDMIELGFRSKITKNVQLDVDVFVQDVKGLTAILQASPTQQKFFNVPTTAQQIGTTISLNFVPNDKIQFKPFVTLQKTETSDLPSIYLDPALPSPPFPPVTYNNSTHKYTPGTYGGFYFNYRPSTKANVNISAYYLGEQTQYDASYDDTDSSTPQYANGQIDGKFIMSAKASYEVVKNLNVFLNARNFLGADTREFYAADRTAGLYTGGISYNLK
ncbi:TonB-dependent receptor [Chryseotalea sanaruensis]|uniref:TonB-dependent receptor n=2 Tax=Chryseotalea sanaruensis TaxID=2482724 RepID=A0A401U885_9BACT|nr:TonB-dependent receptor [Chryseotalea sanaruensis]